jgi:hypothetical protein
MCALLAPCDPLARAMCHVSRGMDLEEEGAGAGLDLGCSYGMGSGCPSCLAGWPRASRPCRPSSIQGASHPSQLINVDGG